MGWVAVKWIPQLFSAFNSLWPKRNHAQDGTIGDDAHKKKKSGHNADDTAGSLPEREDADTKQEVRAADVDARGVDMQRAIDAILADPNERKRFIYIIFNGWQYTINHLSNGSTTVSKKKYTEVDQHITHAHYSGHPDYDEDARPFAFAQQSGDDDMTPSQEALLANCERLLSAMCTRLSADQGPGESADRTNIILVKPWNDGPLEVRNPVDWMMDQLETLAAGSPPEFDYAKLAKALLSEIKGQA